MKRIALLCLIITIPFVATAQYLNTYEYTPMQADFENESFFYQPSVMTPAYLGSFSQLEPGFTQSPLNQLAQNPAWLPDLNGHDLYAYADVRSRNMYKAYQNNCCIYLDNSSDVNPVGSYYPFPYYDPYGNADGHRLQQEPFISAAFTGYPFVNKKIFAGITYQAIISKEDYYAYPSNSYPGNLSDVELAMGSISPTEYFQRSTLKQTGHFLSLYGGYQLSDRATLGLKIGVALFQRDGGYGNTTLSNTCTDGCYFTALDAALTPNDLLTEQRSQHYRHLDVDLGGSYVLNSKLTGMAHFGYLVGSGDEELNSSVPSYFENGTAGSGSYYNLHENVSTYLDRWNNSGHTFYGGFSLRYKVMPGSRIRFLYEISGNGTGLNPSARSGSFSYTDNQPGGNVNYKEQIITMQSSTLHSGSGKQHTWSHQAGIFYEWSPVGLLTLNAGVQYDHYSSHIHTYESNDITGSIITQTTDTTGKITTVNQPINSRPSVGWSNYLREFNFQFPFVAQVHLFRKFEIWAGFNELIEGIKVRDNTLDPSSVTGNRSTYSSSLDPYNESRATQYRFTLLGGLSYTLNDKITFHVMGLPLDHRFSYVATRQTSGLVWQAGVSIYP